jgi:arylsulfatase
LCAALLALPIGCAEAAPDLGIVFVVVDTVRADHLSVYGAARPTTPTLARWAERGAVFEHAFAASPWTVPSMASLLTGRIPTAHGAGFRSGRRHGFTVLREDVQTLAQLLSQRGYETAAIVNNVFLGKGFGLDRGFGRYDHMPATDLELRRGDEVVDLALDWLRQPRDAPSFLLVHLMDPHIAYDPPPSVRGRFTAEIESSFSLPVRKPGSIRKRRERPPEADRRFLAAAYDEELLGVDRALGRLLIELEGDGLLSRSLVLLTSDHGEEFFEHGGFEHGHALYQELLHVPLILWGPGVAPGRYAPPASLVDAVPTALEAVGAEVPEGLAGRSLWGLLTRGEALPPRDLVAESLLRGPERRALVRWPYKLDTRQGAGRVRLFDLEADPGERNNLAPRRPELVAELRRALDALGEAEEGSEPILAPVSEEMREKLIGLGYIE